MKYAISNSTGDAGEYFFAYYLTTTLGWPCRLLDIDIGVDAQIEILDESHSSTGRFIAVQIKATRDSAISELYIPVAHIQYWQSVEAPVLIALVDLKKKIVYIQTVSKSANYTVAKAGSDKVKISFDKAVDRLSIKKRSMLQNLGFAEEIKEIKNLTTEVERECQKILIETSDGDAIIEDSDHYLEVMRDFRSFETKLLAAKVKVDKIQRLVGDCGYNDAASL
jgi:hypothetical protein